MFGMQGITPQSAQAQKGSNKRQVIQQIIHNNGSGNILFSSGGVAPIQQNPLQNKRAQQQYGVQGYNGANVGKAYQTPIFKQQEREELKNMYRNLKIQYNITKDENTRLRTRAQQMHIDLSKKEKDVENLTR